MFKNTLAVMASAFIIFISACGGSSGGDGSYTIEFSNVSSQMEGKSTFLITIKNSSGDGVSDLSPEISVWMAMESMNHSTPMGSVTDNGDGTYTVVVYYLMASSMNGMSMGTWNVDVTVGDQTETFNPDVMMAMGDTARVTLKNQDDQFAGMMGASVRSYYIFKESLMGSTGSHMFKVFLATRESMMDHPAVYTGQTLTDANGASWAVNSVTLEVSTDNGASWASMTENGSGYFSVSGLAGLVDGSEGSILVRLSINGAQYTTDGAAASGDNAYQTFTVTPGSSMSM